MKTATDLALYAFLAYAAATTGELIATSVLAASHGLFFPLMLPLTLHPFRKEA